MTRLVDVDRSRRWTGTRAIQLQHLCPTCRTPYLRGVVGHQDALFIHGGYGATTQLQVVVCWCGLVTTDAHTVRPPRTP